MFEESKQTADLRERLEQGSPGNKLTPSEVEAITGISDLLKQQRHFYAVARKVHKHNNDIIWRWSRERKCYCCLTEVEKVPFVSTRIRKARNQSITGRRAVEGCDQSQLTEEQRSKLVVSGVLAHLIERSTEHRTIKQLESNTKKLILPDYGDIARICKSRVSDVK